MDDVALEPARADSAVPDRRRMTVKLYTDSYVVRGWVTTPHRRLSDLLNLGEQDFLVVEEVRLEEFGSGNPIRQAPYAQINLATVLFGVAEEEVQPAPELRVVEAPERALIVVPPFHIAGRIHLPQETELHAALLGLTGRFIPVTEVTFWSDSLREPRTRVPMVAVNHARAQIFAPYEERDVWEGLDRTASSRAGLPTSG